MTYVLRPTSSGPKRASVPTSITLVAGEYGTARELTDEVMRLLDERRVDYQVVPGHRVARRSMPLPTIVATFGADARQVTYDGFGRILLDFLPLIAAA